TKRATRPSSFAPPEEMPALRGGSSVVERQFRELREQLAEARAENEKLTERLLKKSADLQSALVEVDKTKVSVVELKAQLAQATAVLEDTRKDGDSFGAIREQFDKKVVAVLTKLTEAEADNEVLKDENARLLTKLDQASKYIVTSDSIRENLLKERLKLADARDTAVSKAKKIKDNTAEIERVAAENKKLKTEVAQITKNSVSQEDFEKLTAENKSLADKLATAEKNSATKAEVEKISEEKKAVEQKLAQAESALKDSAATSVSKDEFEKVAAEKRVVEEKLAQTEKSLSDSGAGANPENDKLIASLQSDLNSVNDKLLEAQAQTSRSDDQLKALQKQLDEASGELAQFKLNPEPSKEEKNLNTENELLRGIVLRQIKEQTQRDEAKKQLEQEIAALQIKSAVISQQLAVLGAPIIQLTAEERSLFKEPVALLNEPNPGSLEVAMAVTKPSAEETKPAASEPSPNPEVLPEDVRELVQQAKKLFDQRDYAGTEKVYQEIVAIIPENYFALSNLAAVQIESGKLSAAEVALKKAVAINDKDSFAYTNLGILYSRQGKFSEAIAALEKAIALNDKDSVAHNYLGVCLGQKDQREGAEKEFKRAIDINQDYPDAHFNLAVLYATTQPQSIELAKHYYNRATELGAAPDPSLERLIQ
ncbi:MAG: tetratricopeptide repeat protein, partial [Terrimicrobiaceae bacterium]